MVASSKGVQLLFFNLRLRCKTHQNSLDVLSLCLRKQKSILILQNEKNFLELGLVTHTYNQCVQTCVPQCIYLLSHWWAQVNCMLSILWISGKDWESEGVCGILISGLLDTGWFDHIEDLFLILKGTFTLLSIVNTNLHVQQQCFDVLLSLQTSANISSLFSVWHSSLCWDWDGTPRWFDLHFADDAGCWAPLYTPAGNSQVLLWEISIQIF